MGTLFVMSLFTAGAIWLGNKIADEIAEDTNHGYVTVQREQSGEQK